MSAYFEVVSKGPVAQHLEVGVMVHIFAHIIKVVVLASGTDTFLAVYGTLQLAKVTVGIHRALEDGLELEHNQQFSWSEYLLNKYRQWYSIFHITTNHSLQTQKYHACRCPGSLHVFRRHDIDHINKQVLIVFLEAEFQQPALFHCQRIIKHNSKYLSHQLSQPGRTTGWPTLILTTVGQCYCCWWPDSLYHQDISNHACFWLCRINSLSSMRNNLFAPSVLRYDRKCNYIFVFSGINTLQELIYMQLPGGHFNIKMPSYQYRDSHVKDKTVLWPSYL